MKVPSLNVAGQNAHHNEDVRRSKKKSVSSISRRCQMTERRQMKEISNLTIKWVGKLDKVLLTSSIGNDVRHICPQLPRGIKSSEEFAEKYRSSLEAPGVLISHTG
ncbi:hypothetical protein Tco_0690360 [Tanacetum coccineum]